MPALDAAHCYTTYPKIAEISSVRMFCGGYEDQDKGACFGDSGGGFFMRDELSLSWNILGIVSSSLINDRFGCDVDKPSLFTNVSKFLLWIREVTNDIKDDVVEFTCQLDM